MMEVQPNSHVIDPVTGERRRIVPKPMIQLRENKLKEKTDI